MEKAVSRTRSWIITQSADKISFEDLTKALEQYVYIGQKEKGKQGGDQGYEHYQIYIENPTAVRFDTLKNKLPNAHIEPRQGSKRQAFEYVTKSDTKIGEVFGNGDIDLTPDSQGKRNDLLEIIDQLSAGVPMDELREQYKTQFVIYENRIKSYMQSLLGAKYKKVFRNLTTTYIHGSTGRGKTRYVMERYGYENVYRVTNYLHPFDMYDGQPTIIFEEFRSSLKIEQMLNYLDGYPLTLPARYGDKIACFDTVYIISNIPLSGQYNNIQTEQPETYNALLRRIGCVWDCDNQLEPQPRVQPQAKQLKLSDLVPLENNGNLPF